MQKVKVIGGGLAGVESAYQLLKRGIAVDMYEMRGVKNTPCHTTTNLAELVCSNSLKSMEPSTSQGTLKQEMSLMGSLVLECAAKAKVDGGGALVVNREDFSRVVEETLLSYKNFHLIREEYDIIDDEYTIIATGPLTSAKMEKELAKLGGKEHLHFYDAVSPIISADSIDYQSAFFGSRYDKGTADYLNCPMTKEEYTLFYRAIVEAETVILKDFEKGDVFEACMPIEVMAKRGEETMRYGTMRPVGIKDPKTGFRPYAVVQLRKEDNYNGLYNIVGFQTNLKFAEQKRVFSLIPALKNAEFVRYGVMHRNTYIDSPKILDKHFKVKKCQNLFVAGQITGVEGYMESAMSGLLAGYNMYRHISGLPMLDLPITSMMGSLSDYIARENTKFLPMHVSFELVPPLTEQIKDKHNRKIAYNNRAIEDITRSLYEF